MAYKLGDVIDHEFMKCELAGSPLRCHLGKNGVLIIHCISDKILATLGEGTFGKVVKVKELNS